MPFHFLGFPSLFSHTMTLRACDVGCGCLLACVRLRPMISQRKKGQNGKQKQNPSFLLVSLPPSSFPELNVCLLAKRRGVRVRGMRPSPHFPPRLRFSFLLTTRRSPLSRRVRRVPWVQCLLSSGRERSASGSESGVDDGAAAVRSSTKLSRRVLVNCFNFPGKRVRMRVNECRSP